MHRRETTKTVYQGANYEICSSYALGSGSRSIYLFIYLFVYYLLTLEMSSPSFTQADFELLGHSLLFGACVSYLKDTVTIYLTGTRKGNSF